MAQIQFKITPWKEDGEIEHESQCVVHLSLGSFADKPFEIEVRRTRTQIQALSRDLRAYFVSDDSDDGNTDCESACSTPTYMEESLNKLIATKGAVLIEEPWNCQVLMVFLDDAPYPTCFNSSTFTVMKNKIKALEYNGKRSFQMIEDLQSQFSLLASQMESLQLMMQIQHQGPSGSNHQAPPTAAQHSLLVHANTSVPTARSGTPDAPLESFHSSDSDSADPFVNKLPDLQPPTASTSDAMVDHISLSLPEDVIESTSPLSALSHSSRFNVSAPEFSPTSGSSAKSMAVLSSFQSGALPSSTLLPSAVYAQILEEDPLNRFVEELISAISPQQAQVQYRDSIVALLQRNFRSVLNCEALEVGLHRLLCFLPDDPIKVSAVVCRNHSTKWHRVICDRLNLVAKKKSEELAGEGYSYRSDRSEESDDSSGEHVIRNVVISNTKLNILVQCSIDNLEVELTCNSRSDVCMLALLEEISLLVGKDNLFKQSLQLIRAWWCYECSAYVGAVMKYYLADFSLCLMVAAIFNQHHARLHTPLQALCAFLAEYSAYDGTVSAITLMGIVPFKSTTSNQPVLSPLLHPAATASPASPATASQGYLLGPDVMERYWLLYCPPDASNPEQQQLKIFSALSSSSEDVVGVDPTSGIMNINSSVSVDFHGGHSHPSVNLGVSGIGTEDVNAPSLEEAALASHRQACARNLAKFDRSQFNVVDPFTCNNMLVERPSQNRIVRLVKIFQTGASQMNSVLTQLKQRSAASPRDAVASFFPATVGRFLNSLVRPDTFNMDNTFVSPAQLSQLTRKIPMKVSIDDLARQMRYCNLMVESVISRSAVLDLVVEILTQKGPLPIGEVGKALAELTCITGLSSRLKEAYGGLKKFLEDFSTVVIIGTDHPFNPHIVLRSSLSAENLAMNDSGVFPANAVLRMKKITATSLRKAGPFANKPMLQQGMGVPQHPVYRTGGGPSNLAGVGIGGMMQENRGPPGQVQRHQGQGMIDPRATMMPPVPYSTYGQQPQGHQQVHHHLQQQQHLPPPPPQQHHHHQYQQQPQQQPPQHGNLGGQYTYNAKIMSNMHADARDRESTATSTATTNARTHAIQNSVFPGMERKLERHFSGSSHGSSAYGGFAESNVPYVSGSNVSSGNSVDTFEEVLGNGNGSGSQQGDLYGQRSPQQYHEPPAEHLRMRVPSYSHPSPPAPASRQLPRPAYPPQPQDMHGHGFAPPQPPQQQHQQQHQQQREFHSPQLQQQGGMGGQARQQDSFSFELGNGSQGRALNGQNPSLYGQPLQNQARENRDYPASPNTGGISSGFAIDSYFDSSVAPLNDSFSGQGSRPSSIRSSGTFSNAGLGARFEEVSLDAPLFAGLQGAGAGSMLGTGGGGARSLLSGLREGTVELMDQQRDWDLFQAQSQQQQQQHHQSSGSSPEWRNSTDRKY